MIGYGGPLEGEGVSSFLFVFSSLVTFPSSKDTQPKLVVHFSIHRHAQTTQQDTMPKPDTMARMQSTTLDHQKGNKLWVHDAVPRHYHYHPFSTQVSGITPEGGGG